MKSRTTRKFWRLFEALTAEVQEHARTAYQHFHDDPAYPSLNFKRVDPVEPLYSVRIGIHYRAVGLLEGNTITWFWIGIYADYDRLLKG